MAYQNKADQGEVIKTEVQKYLRYWYLLLIGVVIALTSAYLYLRYTPEVYSSSAKIKILNKSKGLELPSAAFIFNRSNINLENEIEILKSYRIIEKVVKNLDLTMRFYEEGNVLTTEIDALPFPVVKTIANDSMRWASYTIKVSENGFAMGRTNSEQFQTFSNYTTLGSQHDFPFELNPTGRQDFKNIYGKTYLITFAPVAAITQQLKNKIEINKVGKGSDLLEISHKSQSEARNERIINELIKVFNRDGIEDRQDVSLRTMRFIDDRFKLLVEELDSIETNIKDFKQRNNLISVETDAELGLSQRTESEAALFEVENQQLLADLLKESMTEGLQQGQLLPENLGLSSVDVNASVTQYNTVMLEIRDLRASGAGMNNPRVKLLNTQLDELKANILQSLEAYDQQLAITKQQLERKNQKFASKVYSIPTKEKVLLDIKRQQQIKQTLYIFLLQKREEAAINYAITEPTIKVVEHALSSGWALSPNRKSVYTTAIAAGLGIPVVLIYIIMLLDTKLKTRRDIEQVTTAIPVVGELPKLKKEHEKLFTNPNDNSIQAEAFRILSANVDYVLPVKSGSEGQVMFCTSTIKGEGKTYVSINLSLALSSLNKKVLLIGADLRNPQLHAYINQDKHQEGLANYLHEPDFNWRSHLIKAFNGHPQHHMLLAGSMPPNPAHLLTNGRFKTLIDEAKHEFDYVIVDTAPTILVTDTMLIAGLADATLYITRANFTEKKLLNYSKELSESGKLKNMVYVINGVDDRKGYGYSYNYGYNYGYSAKNS